MEKIGFPGFGLEFEINPTAFTIFGLDIQWYGVIISFGILCAFLLFNYLGVKKEGILSDDIYSATIFAVPLAVVGARFFYVFTKWEDYKGTGFINIINIRGGGLAIYGGIIFGLITVLIFNKIKKSSSLSMLDALAPAVMLGQAIGRWGNFVNAEAYGWSEGIENLPWRMWIERVHVDGFYQPNLHLVHPTFLYESLWNLLGLTLILAILYRKKKFDGEIFFAYIGWYGLGRTFIESIRADSLYLPGTNLKFSVATGVFCVIIAIVGIVVLGKRKKEEEQELSEYTPAFAAIKAELEKEGDALSIKTFETEDASLEPQFPEADELQTEVSETEETFESIEEQEIDKA